MDRIKALFKSRTAKICLLLAAALLLLLALKLVFGGSSPASSFEPTDREARLMTLLNEIEGVESSTAMITEEGGRAVSAVVVFSGEDSILVRSRLLNIVSSALGIAKENVQVYPAQKP